MVYFGLVPWLTYRSPAASACVWAHLSPFVLDWCIRKDLPRCWRDMVHPFCRTLLARQAVVRTLQQRFWGWGGCSRYYEDAVRFVPNLVVGTIHHDHGLVLIDEKNCLSKWRWNTALSSESISAELTKIILVDAVKDYREKSLQFCVILSLKVGITYDFMSGAHDRCLSTKRKRPENQSDSRISNRTQLGVQYRLTA